MFFGNEDRSDAHEIDNVILFSTSKHVIIADSQFQTRVWHEEMDKWNLEGEGGRWERKNCVPLNIYMCLLPNQIREGGRERERELFMRLVGEAKFAFLKYI